MCFPLFVVLLFSCEKEVQIPSDIKEIVNILLEDEETSKKDTVKNKNLYVHPDVNWIGIPMKYSTDIKLKNISNGTYLYSNFKIIHIQKGQGDINWRSGKTYKEKADYYLVNVKYNVTGEVIKKSRIAKKEKHIISIVLLKDENDEKYKLFDQLPSGRIFYYNEKNKNVEDINEIIKND